MPGAGTTGTTAPAVVVPGGVPKKPAGLLGFTAQEPLEPLEPHKLNCSARECDRSNARCEEACPSRSGHTDRCRSRDERAPRAHSCKEEQKAVVPVVPVVRVLENLNNTGRLLPVWIR